MSYRINLYGYDCDRMRRLFGSKDAAAIARLDDLVESNANYQRDSASRSECKKIIARAVNEGVPFSDLVDETHVHTSAAQLLAADGQQWLFTNCAYRWESVQILKRIAWKYASEDVRAFITALNSGSPMFGQRFATVDAPYYASLSLTKVAGFCQGLLELRDKLSLHIARDDELEWVNGFLSDLIGDLAQIASAKMDCWYMTG
jgi:hypothetical protein